MSLILLLPKRDQTDKQLNLLLRLSLPNFLPAIPNIAPPVVVPDPVTFEDDDTLSASVISFRIAGITRDRTNNPLPFCTVDLFETLADRKVQTMVSDANGAYSFSVVQGVAYYVVAYKGGMTTSDVFGTTANNLVGV